MKTLTLLLLLLLPVFVFAQNTSPGGKVYGVKPSTTGMVAATKVESIMYNKTRISTTISGKVLEVTQPKGGWFTIDAGNGKLIAAHFKVYNIYIPASLKGKQVIAEGVIQKQFIADDGQHLAGDTVTGKKQHSVKTNPKQKLTFEVTGLMVGN